MLASGDDIYNDQTKEYLEYEIILTTSDMQLIKQNTAKSTYDYGEMPTCPSGTTRTSGTKTDDDYCFICNDDNKECISTFITAYATESDGAYSLENTRDNKWKYYINNDWKIGSMSSIPEFNWNFSIGSDTKKLNEYEGFDTGRYPNPENDSAYLKEFKNWP